MSPLIFLSGSLIFKPELKETRNGKPWARILLEVESTREARKGEFVTETTIMPINCFALCCAQVKDLQRGDALTISCRLTGTKFESDSGTKYGVQLVGEKAFLNVAVKETNAR
jgi:single-stranded DNA-binding protein